MDIILYISLPIIILYSLLVLILSFYWIKMPIFSYEKNINFDDNTKFSIIIPFRNEEDNLANIIHDLENQHYPISLFEVIIIDDDSTDNSKIIAQELIAKSKIKLTLLNSIGGKKKAVQKGLIQAKGDFIISLDADVRIKSEHLQTYNHYYQQTKAKLIAGPVSFTTDKNILNKLFGLEFISLIASGAAAIGLGKPIMLNAANMGFERSVALEFQSEVYQSNLASGDDQFLLEAIENNYGGNSIHFLKSNQAIAKTKPPESLSIFINQRIRWASKTSSYSSIYSQLVALLVFLYNLLLTASFIYSITQLCVTPFIVLFSIKFIIDLPILIDASIFFKKQKLLLLYPIIQFFYPWYIVIIAVLSLFKGYQWKGRKIK